MQMVRQGPSVKPPVLEVSQARTRRRLPQDSATLVVVSSAQIRIPIPIPLVLVPLELALAIPATRAEAVYSEANQLVVDYLVALQQAPPKLQVVSLALLTTMLLRVCRRWWQF